MAMTPELVSDISTVTKKSNRTRKQSAKFIPLVGRKANDYPTPEVQEALHNLYNGLSAAEKEAVRKVLTAPEFMKDGYGKSTRYLKSLMSTTPTTVKL
jgi:hypothetical protein